MPDLTKLCLGATLALSLALPALADSTTAPASGSTTTAPATAPSTDGSAAAKTPAPPPSADKVVATVNGTKITLGDMIALRDQLPAQYKQVPDDVLFKAILDQLIQQTLLEQSIEPKLTGMQKLELANTKRAFLANLVLQDVSQQATSDEALKKAYDAKYANVDPGLEYHAAHILVPTEKEAQDIKKQLDGGADFASLAKKDSKDGSAQQGGDLGWFGLGMMVKPFEDAVAKLKPGEVSQPVQTQFGWHIIKLIDTRPAKKPDMAEVKPELQQQLEQDAVQAKLKELTDGAKIDRSAEGIDPSVLSDTSLVK